MPYMCELSKSSTVICDSEKFMLKDTNQAFRIELLYYYEGFEERKDLQERVIIEFSMIVSPNLVLVRD